MDLKDGSSINQTKEGGFNVLWKIFKKKKLQIFQLFRRRTTSDFAALLKQSALKDKESQAEIMVNIKNKR